MKYKANLFINGEKWKSYYSSVRLSPEIKIPVLLEKFYEVEDLLYESPKFVFRHQKTVSVSKRMIITNYRLIDII